jgi:hypothetical protein
VNWDPPRRIAVQKECGSFRIRIQVKSKASFQKPEKRPENSSSTEGKYHVDRGFHLDGITVEQVGPVAP